MEEPAQETIRYDDQDESHSKRTIDGRSKSNENEATANSNENNDQATMSCSPSKIRHSIIPQRSRGFIFHKFHGHTPTLLHCNTKCCEKEDCILSFKLERSCYGVLCGRDRNCHVKRDKLSQLKIYFSNVEHGRYSRIFRIFWKIFRRINIQRLI